jgi:hypothetical protein
MFLRIHEIEFCIGTALDKKQNFSDKKVQSPLLNLFFLKNWLSIFEPSMEKYFSDNTDSRNSAKIKLVTFSKRLAQKFCKLTLISKIY